MSTMTRSYQELIEIPTFEERFEYLNLEGRVGEDTFGHDRWLNQAFYTSYQWRRVRNVVIARDLGRDLACEGYDILDTYTESRIIIHHMNPMTPQDLTRGSEDILDPEYLITTTHRTHNAIHYGDRSLIRVNYVERRPGDTTLWR